MKLVILSVLCVIAVIASPLSESEANKIGDAGEYVKIPDGFGGMKYVNLAVEEQEISPTFNIAQDTRFLLFTRLNPTIPQELRANDINTIHSSHFSPSRPTRILIHGWQSDVNSDVNILTTAGYLRSYDVNVLVVDWSVGANTINYITSRNHVNGVGAFLAEFLDLLQALGFLINFSRVSCIGHSLGAHICGHAGKSVRSGRLNTIIGLDPAGPLFDANNPFNRLASTDAEYVESIHTDIAQFGIGFNIADADFYPNGGTGMPGCLTAICDHGMAVNYFVESLNSGLLWGRRCSHFDEMQQDRCTGVGNSMGGEPSNFRLNLNGILRMATNANSPFGRGQF